MQSKSIVTVVLALAGLYFLLVHRAPLPFNHEAIGLGTNHMAHSVFGVILLVGAGYIWWKDKGSKTKPEVRN